MPSSAFSFMLPGSGITAHRGNAGQYPENTLRAFSSGLESGADWIELDVRETADGRLVVIHDGDAKRTAGIALEVATADFDRLRALDAARVFREQRGLSLEACPAARVPLLTEVLELVLLYRRARVSIQPKTDCVEAIVAQIRALGADEWVGFNDGSREKLALARRLLPAAPIFLDVSPDSPPLADSIAFALAHRFESIVMHRSQVTPEAVRQVREAGLEAGAWTVNDLGEARRFDAFGLERFYTDIPTALLFGLSRHARVQAHGAP